MKLLNMSFTFHTKHISECLEFYMNYFDTVVTFACDWYVTIKFDSDTDNNIILSFIDPAYSKKPETECQAIINIMVEDVNDIYNRIIQTGIKIERNLENMPHGYRSFTIADPIGNILFIYSAISPDENSGCHDTSKI